MTELSDSMTDLALRDAHVVWTVDVPGGMRRTELEKVGWDSG